MVGLTNVVASAPQSGRDQIRRPLVVMLYAHYEGFCKFALQHYCRAVTDERLPAWRCSPAVVAGGLGEVFKAMQSGDAKCKVFGRQLPDDSSLHAHARRRDFVEEFGRLMAGPLEIDEAVVGTEGNLTPRVLRRNLYVLGLDYAFVDRHESAINRLLGRRNSVAHGDRVRGYPESEYAELELSVRAVFEEVRRQLIEAFGRRLFEGPTAGA